MDRWCAEREVGRGAVLGTDQCWTLAQRWYEGRDRMDWQPRTTAETKRIFEAVGLTGAFWELD